MKIIVTGDVLRGGNFGEVAKSSDFFGNIKTLMRLLGDAGLPFPCVELSTPATVSQTAWLDTDGPTLYECWHLKQQHVPIRGCDIVVGFELPLNAIYQFGRRGIRYIDVSDHPVRYGEKLYGLAGSYDFKRFKRNVRKPEFAPADEKTPFVLIVGQVPFDRSLVHNKKLVKLEDFLPQIEAVKASPVRVLFRPHPCGHGHGEELMRSLGIEVTHTPTYNLLASPMCSHVCGISSSVLYEARLFGVPSTFWCEREQVRQYVPVAESMFTTDWFWKKLLA